MPPPDSTPNPTRGYRRLHDRAMRATTRAARSSTPRRHEKALTAHLVAAAATGGHGHRRHTPFVVYHRRWLAKNGPYRYRHGWILIGAPKPGDRVHHPEHGLGTVHSVGDGEASVRFRDGATHTITHHHSTSTDSGPGHFELHDPDHAHDANAAAFADYHNRVQRLRDAAATGIRSSTAPDDPGEQSTADIVTFNDGTKALRKTVNKPDQADAEELTPLVGTALGLKMPAVARTGADQILMEYVDGKTGYRATTDEKQHVVESDTGGRIKLLDDIVGNGDRHEGNWMIDRRGNIVPIDNAYAFKQHKLLDTGDRVESLFDEYDEAPTFSAAQFAAWRTNIEGTRADFARLGHEDWYARMMREFDADAAAAPPAGP